MRLLPDNRAQSIQIGAVLLFGVLIVLLATWQAFVIPDQNEEVEFNHNEDLQQQMTDLRSTTNSMPNTLSTRSVTVDLGMRYPTRTIFRNPGPVSGTIETVGTDDEAFNLTINNAKALETNVADFWGGSEQFYDTGAIEYRPNYNLYDNAPETVYEHSVLFNRFNLEESTLPRTGQALVRDDRITVVAIDGDLQEERVESTSVDIEPISTDTRRVEIEDDDGPVTIELVTGLAEQRWQNILREENVSRGGNVERVSTSSLPDTDRELLTIELAEGEDYTLQMAKVGFGSGASETDKAYLTDIEGDDSSIQPGNNQRLVVEVRDKFNNPKRSVEVDASAEGGQFRDGTTETSATSDSDGQASFRYTGEASGENNINFTIADGYQPEPDGDHQANAPENVTMTVDVQSPPGGGGGASAFNVTWDDPDPQDGVFEYNVTEQGEPLDLTASTDPETDGASIEYAVSDRSVGTLDTSGAETTSRGESLEPAFDPEEEGRVDLFIWGGGSGDRLEIEVTGLDEEDDDQAQLEIQDFSDELPDGETEPVAADEEIDVEVEEIGGDVDAEDVEISLSIEDQDTGDPVALDEEMFTRTINAGGSETVTFATDEEIDAGDYNATVTAENGDVDGDERTESFTVEDEEDPDPTRFGVFAMPDGEFEGGSGNDELEASFDVDTGDNVYSFSIDASVSGAGNEDVSVTIEGNEYEFTDTAAEEFTRDASEKDLLDEGNYVDEDQLIVDISEDIDEDSDVTDLSQDGGGRDLEPPNIREQ